LTIYLDIDVEEGLRRKLAAHQAGEAEWNRMDQQEIAFHRRVRQGYLQMVAAEPERWVVIEAAQPADVAQRAIRAEVEARLRAADQKLVASRMEIAQRADSG